MASEYPNYVEELSPILRLSRDITVRPLYHSDAEESARLANTRLILRNMTTTWPDPYTVQGAHDFINIAQDPSKWQPAGPVPTTGEDDRVKLPFAWAIAQDGLLIGGIGLKFFPGTVEERHIGLGYWLGVEHWGKGIATEVLRAMVSWIWEQYPNVIRLEATVYSWNPASGRVLEKAGFELEGVHKSKIWRFNEVCDLIVYGLVRENFTA